VLDALEARFGQVPGTVQEKILAQTDVTVLRELLRRACVAPDLARFQEKL